MSYRPEGLSAEQVWEQVEGVKTAPELIELGMDKMLEALKKEGIKVEVSETGFNYTIADRLWFLGKLSQRGTLVFIPDLP